jgi:hypothetical protein
MVNRKPCANAGNGLYMGFAALQEDGRAKSLSVVD